MSATIWKDHAGLLIPDDVTPRPPMTAEERVRAEREARDEVYVRELDEYTERWWRDYTRLQMSYEDADNRREAQRWREAKQAVQSLLPRDSCEKDPEP